MKRYVMWGLVLVLAGAYFLLAEIFDLPESIFLIFLGLAFLCGRLVTRKSGLTIPACLLFWLGAGLTLQHYFILTPSTVAVVFLSLCLGFLFTHIIDSRRLGNWPLIPAVALFAAAGALILLTDRTLYLLVQPFLVYLLPAVLIVLGIGFLLAALVRGKHAGSHKGNPSFERETWSAGPAPVFEEEPPVQEQSDTQQTQDNNEQQ